MYAIGIDIGGTKVAIALVNEEGTILAQEKLLTDQTIPPKDMIDQIINTTKSILETQQISVQSLAGIGIGAPGPIDTQKGEISRPPNLKDWVNIPVVEMMEQAFNVPVAFENDATAAALAEKWLGAAKVCDDFIYVTISTGIGAGIYANSKLLTGRKGNAGDIGHTVVNPSFGTCACGQMGCIEHIASGTAISKKGSELLNQSLSTADVFERFNQKDPIITPYMDDVLRALGAMCVSLINTFEPERIIFGGGVSKVGAPLLDPIRDYIRQYALNPDNRATPIQVATLDQNAGVIGAAALILHKPEMSKTT
ncbi:glucokinase [Pelagirhabdus alkalitolerans]|uniref:Glucokinase n=1 Tax=Pelagirhabdus alkalitolerans TaxID=1612202 RepID=A0A1G6GP04_9BACI|nr:ROK family protein [Pelagirhabdus alkalitolerans]SDB82916.1 glucokinase [Pelagirhabdus alkalitolerans]